MSLAARRAQFATLLSTMTAANGYPSDVQTVRTGRNALVIEDDAARPAVAVHAPRETPSGSPGMFPDVGDHWEAQIVVEAHCDIADGDAWDEDADVFIDDLRRLIQDNSASWEDLEWVQARKLQPEPSANACVVQATFTLYYQA